MSVSIYTSTSPAVNVSPSFNFQEAIPPSVIVGDIAGIWNLDRAELGAVDRMPRVSYRATARLKGYCALARLKGIMRKEVDREMNRYEAPDGAWDV